MPANRSLGEKSPPIGVHPHNTHTNRGVTERESNENGEEKRSVEGKKPKKKNELGVGLSVINL